MTYIYLIRHAEAEGNLYRRVHGHYDADITMNGYRQIEALRKRFAEIEIDAVYSSDLFRTVATSKAISEPRGLEVITSPELREINLGIWEDLPWGELLVTCPEEYSVWSKTPHKFCIRGGETHDGVFLRIKRKLDALVKENKNKIIAVFCHGAAIRSLLCGILYSGDMSHLNDIGWCDNTSVCLIKVDDDLKYNIEYYNDNSHLDELSTLKKQIWWRSGDDPSLYNLRFIQATLPKDANRLLSYYKDTWDYVFGDEFIESAYAKKRIERMLSTDERAIVYAYRGSEELGVIMLDVTSSPVPNAGHIALIFLKEEYRGYGFGAQLIGHAISVYRALGRKAISVGVSKDNKFAVSFYEKLGFSEYSREISGAFTQLILKKSIELE